MNEHITSIMNEIPIPTNLHDRCEAGIDRAEHEKKGHITMLKFRKSTVAAAVALVLTAGLLTAGGITYADSIRGAFSDVTRFDGAVVGTEYHDATEEIEVTAEAVGDTVIVNARFLYPADAPYASISELSLKNVTLTDSSGTKLLTVAETEITPINNGSVSIAIPMGTVTLSPDEAYTLSFDTAVGHAKAEQPLPMSGNWSCSFAVS
ncbi:MAG: hypothetical protein IKK17_04435 [Oscillospiraceae bacterium]|nr:hypothetical protein [Oscillospiraceae bacterium]